MDSPYDTDEGKPEPNDSERIGLGLSPTREETAFRGTGKTRVKVTLPCTPSGEQVCRSAPNADTRWAMQP